MENTCMEEKCWFYVLIKELAPNKEGMLEFKNCPFYQEMVFTPAPVGATSGTAKLVKDCTCKRSLLFLLEQVYPRLLGVQKSNEEMRNSYESSIVAVKDFVNNFQKIELPNREETPAIEMKKTAYEMVDGDS